MERKTVLAGNMENFTGEGSKERTLFDRFQVSDNCSTCQEQKSCASPSEVLVPH